MTTDELRHWYDRSVDGLLHEIRLSAAEAYPTALQMWERSPERGLLAVLAVNWISGEPLSLQIGLIPDALQEDMPHAATKRS